MEDTQLSQIQLVVSEFLHHSDKYTYQVFVTEFTLTITKKEKVKQVQEVQDHPEVELECENIDSLEYIVDQITPTDESKRKSNLNLKRKNKEEGENQVRDVKFRKMFRKMKEVGWSEFETSSFNKGQSESVDSEVRIVSSRGKSQQRESVDETICDPEASDFTSDIDNSCDDIDEEKITSLEFSQSRVELPQKKAQRTMQGQEVMTRDDFVAQWTDTNTHLVQGQTQDTNGDYHLRDKELQNSLGDTYCDKSVQPIAMTSSTQNVNPQTLLRQTYSSPKSTPPSSKNVHTSIDRNGVNSECFVLIDKLREPVLNLKHIHSESNKFQGSTYKDNERVPRICNDDKDTPVVKSAQGSTFDSVIVFDSNGQSTPIVNNMIAHNAVEHDSPTSKSCPKSVFKIFFRCEVCGQTKANYWQYLKHKAQHLLVEDESIGVKNSLTATIRQKLHRKNQENASQNKCSVCGKICGSSYDLKEHMQVHAKERPKECTICGARFKKTSHLTRHKYVHIPFKCDLCGLSLATPDSINTHMLAHMRLSQLKCKFCGAVFDKVTEMGKHLVVSKSGLCAGQLNQDRGENEAHVPQQIEKDTDSGSSKELKDLKKAVQSEDNFPLKCGICEKGFRTSQQLKNHFKKHPLDMPYHCNECGKGFSNSKDLETHQASHEVGKKYKCGVCTKRFGYFSNLSEHIKEHPRDMPWHCTICRKGFTKLSDHESHKLTHDIDCTNGKPNEGDRCHKQTDERIISEDDLNKEAHDDMSNLVPKVPFECAVCGKCYSKKTRLKKHVKSHPKDMPYHCSICGKGFTVEVNFLDHERMHNLEKPFKCSQCDRSFSVKWDLKNHMKYHNGLIKCQECFQSFLNYQSLRKHMLGCGVLQHQYPRQGGKPKLVRSCVCHLCGGFYTYLSIQQHLRFHLEEKMHECDVCGIRYRLKCLLQKHKINHTDSVSFICEICGKGYKSRAQLRKHSYSCGKWYYCEVCGKKLKNTCTLRRHMDVHMDIIKCSCYVCGKGFRQKTHLQQHMAVHSKK